MESLVWTVADVVVKLRKQKRLGRKKLGKLAHVSYATMTRLETGREMKESSIRKVASALNLTLAELYALVPTAPAAIDAETRERDRLWIRLDEESRLAALGTIRVLADLAQVALVPSPASERSPVSAATAKHNDRGRRPA